MAIQVVPNQQSFGASIGSSLGAGLGQGLSMLAQNKLGELQAQKRAQAWESIGLDPEMAHFIVQSPEWLQKEIVGRLEGLGQKQVQQLPQSSDINQQVMQQEAGQANPIGLSLGKSKSEREEEFKKFKESKEFRKGIISAKKESRSVIKDLDRLEELSASGKLSTPGYVEFLKRSGLDIPALLNPESEEFQKIQQGFLKNAKQYFGSRISNFEVEQFLKTIPSLSQSPEGRKRVIANLKHMARGADEYYKAYEEVLKENKGIPPYDVEERVERKVDARLDRIYKQFKNDLQKPVPKGQSKIITALQAGAGSVLGGIAGAAGTLGGAAGLGKALKFF